MCIMENSSGNSAFESGLKIDGEIDESNGGLVNV